MSDKHWTDDRIKEAFSGGFIGIDDVIALARSEAVEHCCASCGEVPTKDVYHLCEKCVTTRPVPILRTEAAPPEPETLWLSELSESDVAGCHEITEHKPTDGDYRYGLHLRHLKIVGPWMMFTEKGEQAAEDQSQRTCVSLDHCAARNAVAPEPEPQEKAREAVARGGIAPTDNNGYGALVYAPREVVWSRDEAVAMSQRIIALLRESQERIEGWVWQGQNGEYQWKPFGKFDPETDRRATLIIHPTTEEPTDG